MNRSVSFANPSGAVLRGILREPEKVSRSGVDRAGAILLPGLAGNRVGPHRLLYDLAAELGRVGLTTLRLDPSGCGYSDGDPRATTLAAQVEDVHAGIDYLQACCGTEKVLLGGVCRGARLALAASLADPRAQRLILFSCAALNDDDLAAKMKRRRASLLRRYLARLASPRQILRLISGDVHVGQILRMLRRPIASRTMARLAAPPDLSSRLETLAPTLFIYGEGDPDQAASIDYYRRRLGAAGRHARFHIVPDADAGFYAIPWHRQAIAAAARWLEENPL